MSFNLSVEAAQGLTWFILAVTIGIMVLAAREQVRQGKSGKNK